MNNKEIQTIRIKNYFIQATKDILKGEGIKGISVRNIAQKAGYSYATMYNYFKDVNDLVFICVQDFQKECKTYVARKSKESEDGIEKLKASVLAYINYFVEYPGIFDLFYLTRGGDFGNKKTILDVIGNSLDDVCEKDWNYCMTHKIFPIEKVEIIKSQLRYIVIGMLSLYLNRMIPASYSEFMNETVSQINYQFGIEPAKTASKNVKQDNSKVQNSIISVNIG